MATTTLVEFPIDGGRRLVNTMEEQGLPLTVAFWQFQPDDESWQLILATPEVPIKGPRYVIERIHRALDAMSDEERNGLTLRNILILNPRLMRIEEVRARYGVVEHEQDHDDHWKIHSRSEPYIYRLLPS